MCVRFFKSFSFGDIENVKPKFQPRYASNVYAYKKSVLWSNKSVFHEISC